ncbi:MAG TPA: hypothetical protein VGK71_04635 [Nitrospirota bacterium]|jgi:hypothetical protein
MASENEDSYAGKAAGIIPDFFHDIIAYLVPGTIVGVLAYINSIIFTGDPLSFASFKAEGIPLALIVIYVIGRFFETISMYFHHTDEKFWFPACLRSGNPKKDLLTYVKDGKNKYSEEFQNSIRRSFANYYKQVNGDCIMFACTGKQASKVECEIIQDLTKLRRYAIQESGVKLTGEAILGTNISI